MKPLFYCLSFFLYGSLSLGNSCNLGSPPSTMVAGLVEPICKLITALNRHYQNSLGTIANGGRVEIVNGSAHVIPASNSSCDLPGQVPVLAGSKVFSADTIVTGPLSSVKIVMCDNNIIHLLPNSKLEIFRYQNDCDNSRKSGSEKIAVFVLHYGQARFVVTQKYSEGATSYFLTKTPTTAFGVITPSQSEGLDGCEQPQRLPDLLRLKLFTS